MRRRPRAALAALGLATALAATACSVEIEPEDQGSAAIRAFEETGRIRWDLQAGLTREQAGLDGDRRRRAISPPAGTDVLDVEIRVDDEVTITADAQAVLVEGTDAGQPASPSYLNVSRTFPSVEAARAELDRAVEMVGIDADEVRTWEASVQRADAEGDALPFSSYVFDAPSASGIGIEVEAARTSEGRVTISYLLNL